MDKTVIQLNATQQEIVSLHQAKKEARKSSNLIDTAKMSKRIFELRRQLIAELYPVS